MPISDAFRQSMAAYVRELSAWRRAKYDDDLRDPRHLRSADALLRLADYIEALPLDNPELEQLVAFAAHGEMFVPGQQTAYEIGRYQFHDDVLTPEGFLAMLVMVAERDAGEQGRFGGRQVPGDEPWG